MDEREPWYIRYGGGYLAYLFYVVPVLIAVGERLGLARFHPNT